MWLKEVNDGKENALRAELVSRPSGEICREQTYLPTARSRRPDKNREVNHSPA